MNYEKVRVYLHIVHALFQRYDSGKEIYQGILWRHDAAFRLPVRRRRHDWLPEANAVFNKQPFFAVDPFVGCDVSVGEALRMTVKADWLMAIRKTGINRPMGPRIYFGFIFAH